MTYELDRTIDLAGFALDSPWVIFPHELRHVQLGSGSGDHRGWCLDIEPWEEATIGLDESAYLQCDDGQHLAH